MSVWFMIQPDRPEELKASAVWSFLESAESDQTPRGHINTLNLCVLELKRLWSFLQNIWKIQRKVSTWNFRALCLINHLFNSAGPTSGKNLVVLAAPLALSEVRPNSWDESVSRLTSVLAKWISSEEQSIQSIFFGGGNDKWIHSSWDRCLCLCSSTKTSNNLKQHL